MTTLPSGSRSRKRGNSAAKSASSRNSYVPMKARRRHQRGGGIEASAYHEVADCRADRVGNAVVVRTEPDAALGLPHSAAERAGASPEAPAVSAILSVCSATK